MWLRESRRIKDSVDIDTLTPSPVKKRRAAGITTIEEGSPTKKIRNLPALRLHNERLHIFEVKPDESDRDKEVRTGKKTSIWFAEFADEGDHKEIVKKSKTADLDAAYFDVGKMCDLIEEDKKFSFSTGHLCINKAKSRKPGADPKKEYVIRGPFDKDSNHYLQKIIEQLQKGGRDDPEFKFEAKWKADEHWRGL